MEGAEAAMRRAIATTALADRRSSNVQEMVLTELVVNRAMKLDASLVKAMAGMIEMVAADHVIIKSHDNGFFANWLQVS